MFKIWCSRKKASVFIFQGVLSSIVATIGISGNALKKHRKNCERCPTQVTWKAKFICGFCLFCLSCPWPPWPTWLPWPLWPPWPSWPPRLRWPPWPPWPWWLWRPWWPWQPWGSWRFYISNLEVIRGSWRLNTRKLEVVLKQVGGYLISYNLQPV